MQEIEVTREYYEGMKEQIRTALGEKYLSGVRVQDITLDNEYGHVEESFYCFCERDTSEGICW